MWPSLSPGPSSGQQQQQQQQQRTRTRPGGADADADADDVAAALLTLGYASSSKGGGHAHAHSHSHSHGHAHDNEDEAHMDIDPALSACCVKDLEERRLRAAYEARLRAGDVTNRARAVRDAISKEMLPVAAASGSAQALDVLGLVAGGGASRGVAAVLVVDEDARVETSALESSVNDGLAEWASAAERGATKRTCVVHRRLRAGDELCPGDVRLPALMIWSDGVLRMTLDALRLAREPWPRVLALLGTVERSSSSKGSREEEEDGGDDDVGPRKRTTPSTSRCGRAGCDRTFDHVHVQSRWRNQEFVDAEKAAAADDDDDDNGDDDDDFLHRRRP